MVEIEELAVFSLLYLCKFQNKVSIIIYYDVTPFWISVDTNKDDVE